MGDTGVVEEEEELKGGGVIFSYGTLKQGFSNHGLLQDMMATGDASYLGIYTTIHKLPLVCGPYRVPFLLNFPGAGQQVIGELYAVSARALARMDELEGTSRGHYQRLPIEVEPAVTALPDGDGDDHHEEEEEEDKRVNNNTSIRWAEAYYAHDSYAEGMWKRNGEKGFRNYTHQEAKGYVKRTERPSHLSFLDHIRLFLSSSTSP
ncbi:putative gamma-glutamylcyclotransferase At3g02910 [Actinidia eriantha]|uniref:putative gamma-glutamylcyclotransferase At3g02910 n=1 Tax=Actinidia eriantha TaxID=165200 RepID=UPI0025836DC1|nr:putative gamma-glutamylcyclotransferase At3g02910 [Actinidia eriantha]